MDSYLFVYGIYLNEKAISVKKITIGELTNTVNKIKIILLYH